MRSFIKSHRRSQSSGSTEIEDAQYGSDTSTSGSQVVGSFKSRQFLGQLDSTSLPKSQAQANNVNLNVPANSSAGLRSVSDSKVPAGLTEKDRISVSSPRLSTGSFASGQPSMFSSASSGLMPSNSGSSLRKLNPITFIKRRRASNDSPPEFYIPSAEEYKEAGSIFGTRTHDWGPNTTSPVLHPTPVFSSPGVSRSYGASYPAGVVGATGPQIKETQIKETQDNESQAKENLQEKLKENLANEKEVTSDQGGSTSAAPSVIAPSELSLVREDEEDQANQGLGIFEDESPEPDQTLDLIDLKKELSSIIRNSRSINYEEAEYRHNPPDTRECTAALSIEKNSNSGSTLEIPALHGPSGSELPVAEDDDDNHSEFSFEEDTRIGRNSSVNYHKPPRAPMYQQEVHGFVPSNYEVFDGDEEDEDEYLDEYNMDYNDDYDNYDDNDGHLFGTTSFNDVPGTPSMQPAMMSTMPLNGLSPGLSQDVSIVQVSPLRVSTHFVDSSDYDKERDASGYLEDEDEDDAKSYYTARQSLYYPDNEWAEGGGRLYEDTFDGDGEEDENDEYNYDSLLDEVNAVPSDLDDDDYDGELLYRSANSHNRGYYNMGLRKAKSYAFEGRGRSKPVLKRQTSVIKVSDNTTITLFSRLPSSSSTNTTTTTRTSSTSTGGTSSSQSSSISPSRPLKRSSTSPSRLLKRSSTSSSSSGGSTSTMNTTTTTATTSTALAFSSSSGVSSGAAAAASGEQLPSSTFSILSSAEEAAELTYGSFLKDPPIPKFATMTRRASLTPISERSYDSDYSIRSKPDTYDVI